MTDRNDVLQKLLSAAREAAVIVMRIYAEEDVGAELKGPNDPVTRAVWPDTTVVEVDHGFFPVISKRTTCDPALTSERVIGVTPTFLLSTKTVAPRGREST